MFGYIQIFNRKNKELFRDVHKKQLMYHIHSNTFFVQFITIPNFIFYVLLKYAIFQYFLNYNTILSNTQHLCVIRKYLLLFFGKRFYYLGDVFKEILIKSLAHLARILSYILPNFIRINTIFLLKHDK